MGGDPFKVGEKGEEALTDDGVRRRAVAVVGCIDTWPEMCVLR
jgi:hypothetical protein